MSSSEYRTRRLLLCCFTFVLGAVAGWVFVEMVWHGLTQGDFSVGQSASPGILRFLARQHLERGDDRLGPCTAAG
jgi:hypothetical protein